MLKFFKKAISSAVWVSALLNYSVLCTFYTWCVSTIISLVSFLLNLPVSSLLWNTATNLCFTFERVQYMSYAPDEIAPGSFLRAYVLLTLALGYSFAAFLALFVTYRSTFSLMKITCVVGCVTLPALLFFNKSSLLVQFVDSIWRFMNWANADFRIFDLLVDGDNGACTQGVDGLSLPLAVLTLLIFPLCLLANRHGHGSTSHSFTFTRHVSFSMEVLLLGAFCYVDLFYFYIFFEALLIPMFAAIGVWGGRERRVKAAYYFFLYTLCGSLIMLLGILLIITSAGGSIFTTLLISPSHVVLQASAWVCFVIAFSIKLPLFPFHIWLPEAHVEAPTVGSMILASLLLKLGGYGLLRLCGLGLTVGTALLLSFVSVFAIYGVVFGSLNTAVQSDMKRIIAYSSVAHMNFTLFGIFCSAQQGLDGAVYLMIAHGVTSAALFFIIGILYTRYHSRLVRYYGGLVVFMPLFATFFLLFSLANMGFPGTANFVGEVLILLGVFLTNRTLVLLTLPGLVLAAVYTLWLFNRTQHGSFSSEFIMRVSDINIREAAILCILSIMMIASGVHTQFLLSLFTVFASAASNCIFVGLGVAVRRLSSAHRHLNNLTPEQRQDAARERLARYREQQALEATSEQRRVQIKRETRYADAPITFRIFLRIYCGVSPTRWKTAEEDGLWQYWWTKYQSFVQPILWTLTVAFLIYVVILISRYC